MSNYKELKKLIEDSHDLELIKNICVELLKNGSHDESVSEIYGKYYNH